MSTSGGSRGATSPLTTKGDVWGYSTVNARVPVGTDGQVLTARSSATSGIDWEVASNPLAAEVQAATLINATSAGDAGNRADHFTGSVLNAKWTSGGTSSDINVSNSCLTINAPGADIAWIYEPYTPSGAFALQWRWALAPADAQNAEIDVIISDYTGALDPASHGNGVQILTYWPSNGALETTCIFRKIVAGVLTGIVTAAASGVNGMWSYMSYDYTGAGAVGTLRTSQTRSTNLADWVTLGNETRSYAPARIYIRSTTTVGASMDFIDVVV